MQLRSESGSTMDSSMYPVSDHVFGGFTEFDACETVVSPGS